MTDDILGALLSPKAFRATQAAEFIAEHLRNEDEYVQVWDKISVNELIDNLLHVEH